MANLPMMGSAGMQSPTSYFPPAPTGGLGGLGGFINSRQGGDVLQALGMSLMGSPRNAPLQNFGQNLTALQDRTRLSEKDAQAQAQAVQERQALVSAAVAAGVPQDEAQALSASPTALKIRMEQISQEKTARQRNEFIASLPPIGGYDQPAAPAMPSGPASDSPIDSWGALREQYGWAAPTMGEATGDFIEQGQVAPATPQFATQNPNAQNLLRQREQYVQRMLVAPDEASRKVLENYVGQIDTMLKQYEPTAGQRDYQFDQQQRQQMGLPMQPFSVWDAEQAARRRPETNVNVNSGEKAWDTESAKLFAKRYDDITAGASNAMQMMGMYDLAEQALNSGVRTGLGAETELTMRQLGAAMGIDTDPEKLAGGELIRAVQNRMALTMRSPDGGMGMPGALSDRDIKFLKDSQIGIDRSPEGNRRMLTAFRAMENRKIEIAQIADQYIEQHGRLDSGFNRVVREYAQANPLFPDDPDARQGGTGTTSTGVPWSIE